MRPVQKIMIGVTGASGSIYAERLIQLLLGSVDRIYLVVTETGEKVAAHELSSDSILRRSFSGALSKKELTVIRTFKINDLFAPCASGTAAPDAMVVTPCSMGTLARISTGVSSNLLERSADVVLKQKRRLIVCPREMPFNLIHLRNMTALAEAGAEILPLMPGFYQNPKSLEDLVNFCVGKILEQLDIPHDLYKPWNSRMM